MSTEGMAHENQETVTVTLPRELVQQLNEYDAEAARLLGTDGFVAAICREWHGEQVIRKTKARTEELFFFSTKDAKAEGEAESEKEPQPYIFQVRNHHTESCGTPPHFDDPPGVYLSYYENRHGEQNIFLYDYQTKEAFLYMGDAGWERPRKVVEGGRIPGLIYGEDEAAWLFACWMATHFDESSRC
jgi:hypothetical protein